MENTCPVENGRFSYFLQKMKYTSLGGFKRCSIFIPTWCKWSNSTHIFQIGWNHQSLVPQKWTWKPSVVMIYKKFNATSRLFLGRSSQISTTPAINRGTMVCVREIYGSAHVCFTGMVLYRLRCKPFPAPITTRRAPHLFVGNHYWFYWSSRLTATSQENPPNDHVSLTSG